MEELAFSIARGLMRGFIDGLTADADKLPELARGVVLAIRAANATTAVVAGATPDQQQPIDDAIRQAENAGQIPGSVPAGA